MSMEHRHYCRKPQVVTFTGDHGDKLARCETCKAFAVLEPATHAAHTEIAAFRSAWRCREHPNRPVSWKGRGCPDCQRERSLSRAARARRRQNAASILTLGETR